MSELNKSTAFAHYDVMPTEELQEILRKHAHGELETEPDTEELYYIMEVLAERRQRKDPQAFRSNEEALADFKAHYMPKDKPRKESARWLKPLVAAAAVVVLIMSFAFSAEAFDIDILGKIASWSKEFLSFADPTQGTMPTEPDTFDSSEMDSLVDALNKHMIHQKLAPTWLPNGYINTDLNVVQTPRETSISARYEKGSAELIISIRQTVGVEPEQFEKNDSLLEVYTYGDVEYYIFSNTETLQTAWVVDEYECQIIGKVSLEEMKRIINSISE